MRVLAGRPPEGLGQQLQWECNKRRMLLGLQPFPGPRPRWIVKNENSKRRVVVRRKK